MPPLASELHVHAYIPLHHSARIHVYKCFLFAVCIVRKSDYPRLSYIIRECVQHAATFSAVPTRATALSLMKGWSPSTSSGPPSSRTKSSWTPCPSRYSAIALAP